MKRQYLLIALICLLLPILARALWFYQGFYFRSPFDQAPDYEKFMVPLPTLATQPAPEFIEKGFSKKVLIDYAHTNRFNLAEIDSLTQALLHLNASIELDKDGKELTNKLQGADAYVIIAPTTAFNIESIRTVEKFVKRGGRLLIVADPTRTYQNYYVDVQNSILYANQVVDPFRIAFKTDYIYSITHNEGNYRNVFAIPAEKNKLNHDIDNIVFYGAHPLTGVLVPLLKGDKTTLASGTDQGGDSVMAASSMDGRVLALGDMGFMVTPYHQVADNHRLVLNIAEFLAGESRPRSITDFPNLFTRPVVILETEDLNKDKNLLVELSSLQSAYESQGLEIAISRQPEEGKDLLILGIYPSSPVLSNYLLSSGFEMKNSGILDTTLAPVISTNNQASTTPAPPITKIEFKNDTYQFPGIGAIPSRGFNFILYNQGEKRNTLILLAESRKNIIDLIKFINKGSLKGCLIQPNLAVCPSGIAVKEISTPTPLAATSTPTPAEATTPTPTPTPAG
jgi:hypothetical protein